MQEASNVCEVGELFWTMGLFCVGTVCRSLIFALRLSLPSSTGKETQDDRLEERWESCKVLARRPPLYGPSRVCETVNGCSVELHLHFGPNTCGPFIICPLRLIFPYFLPHNYDLAAPNPWISPWNSLISGILFRLSIAHMPSSRPSVLGQDSVQTSAPPESSLCAPQTELSITSLCFNNILVYYLFEFYTINCLEVCYPK